MNIHSRERMTVNHDVTGSSPVGEPEKTTGFYLSLFGSSRFFVGWGTDRRNRKIANQGKKEVIITVTVADSFGDLDLVVEAFELAGAD